MSMTKIEEQSLQQEKSILLANGSVLTLSFNDAFVAKVRKFCNISETDEVSDEHFKQFFAASLAGV